MKLIKKASIGARIVDVSQINDEEFEKRFALFGQNLGERGTDVVLAWYTLSKEEFAKGSLDVSSIFRKKFVSQLCLLKSDSACSIHTVLCWITRGKTCYLMKETSGNSSFSSTEFDSYTIRYSRDDSKMEEIIVFRNDQILPRYLVAARFG